MKLYSAAPKEFASAAWHVESVAFVGGGTGHGSGDVYPNGHRVTARRGGGDETLRCYQSGCFIGLVEPRHVTLVEPSNPEASPGPHTTRR